MADKLEQMLEHLVNDEQEKAEELFHEYVVEKSREIYESLVEEDDEEEVDESFGVEEADEDDMGDMDDMMGGDQTDDLAQDVEHDEEDEEVEDEDAEELFQDLEDIVGELEAKFAELTADDAESDDDEDMDMGDDDEEMDMGDDDEEIKDDFDVELATVREYVEKIGAYEDAKGGDEGKGVAGSSHGTSVSNVNTKSVVDNMKNDMGGTTANILSDTTDEKGRTADKPKEENMGNVNVPGGKASKSMKAQPAGHGAEKKGAGENADNTDSVLRSQR
jgi:hypothetical protein